MFPFVASFSSQTRSCPKRALSKILFLALLYTNNYMIDVTTTTATTASTSTVAHNKDHRSRRVIEASPFLSSSLASLRQDHDHLLSNEDTLALQSLGVSASEIESIQDIIVPSQQQQRPDETTSLEKDPIYDSDYEYESEDEYEQDQEQEPTLGDNSDLDQEDEESYQEDEDEEDERNSWNRKKEWWKDPFSLFDNDGAKTENEKVEMDTTMKKENKIVSDKEWRQQTIGIDLEDNQDAFPDGSDSSKKEAVEVQKIDSFLHDILSSNETTTLTDQHRTTSSNVNHHGIHHSNHEPTLIIDDTSKAISTVMKTQNVPSSTIAVPTLFLLKTIFKASRIMQIFLSFTAGKYVFHMLTQFQQEYIKRKKQKNWNQAPIKLAKDPMIRQEKQRHNDSSQMQWDEEFVTGPTAATGSAESDEELQEDEEEQEDDDLSDSEIQRLEDLGFGRSIPRKRRNDQHDTDTSRSAVTDPHHNQQQQQPQSNLNQGNFWGKKVMLNFHPHSTSTVNRGKDTKAPGYTGLFSGHQIRQKLEMEVKRLAKDVDVWKDRSEKVELERVKIKAENEASRRELSSIRQQLDGLTQTNKLLQAQLRDNSRSLDQAIQMERQKAEDELARVRTAMITVLERERRMMRAQILKTSAEVRSLMKMNKESASNYDEYQATDKLRDV